MSCWLTADILIQFPVDLKMNHQFLVLFLYILYLFTIPSVKIVWLYVSSLECSTSADWMCPGLILIVLQASAFTCTGKLQYV